MPGFRPVYLVNKVGEGKRTSPANRYTGSAETEELFRVGLIHGYFAGVGMDLFFETEQAASLFSLWTLYNPTQMIDALQGGRYGVDWIQKLQFYGPTNRYTGKPAVSDSWTVGMRSRQKDKAINLRFPAERDARRFTEGKEYTGQDLFGTLPAMPADVEDRLRSQYDALIQAEADREAQQAIADRAQQAEVTAIVSAWEAASPPPVTPPPPDPPSTAFLSGAGVGQVRHWWITNGGSAGWYFVSSVAPGFFAIVTPTLLSIHGYVQHLAGTFSTPFNGEMTGDFVDNGVANSGQNFIIY